MANVFVHSIRPLARAYTLQVRGLGIRLATPSPADADAARTIKYASRHKGFRSGQKAKMAAISCESIFGDGQESLKQSRRKAVLIKAAKLGITAKGMRMLKPGVATTPSASRAFSRVRNGSSSSKNNPNASGVGSDGGSQHASVALPREESRKKLPKGEDQHDGSGLEVDASSLFEARAGTTHDVVAEKIRRDARKKRRRHDRLNIGGSTSPQATQLGLCQTSGEPKKLLGNNNEGQVVGGVGNERTKEKQEASTSSREKKRCKTKSASTGSASSPSAVGAGGLIAIASIY